MRPLLSGINWVDQPGTVVTVDNQQGDLIGSNLLTDNISGEVWRAAYAGATRSLRVDFGQVREIGVVGLFVPRDGVQPLQSDRVRILMSAVAVDGSERLDTGAKGMSFETLPWGSWVYPIGAGVRPNLMWNPSLRDSTTGWEGSGNVAPLVVASASQYYGLRDVGGGYADRLGSNLTAGSVTGLQFSGGDYSCIPVAAGTSIQMQALVASTAVSVYAGYYALNSGLSVLGTVATPTIPPKSGQWKYQISEWTPVTTIPTNTPVGSDRIMPFCLSTTGVTVNDPQVAIAEIAVNLTDPSGTVPRYSDNYVTLASNIAATEAVVFARYITIQITSARAYLDIGRLWIGPALVPQYGPGDRSDGITDAGDNLRQALSGIRFPARGAAIRGPQYEWPLLTEREARRLYQVARQAGQTGQVMMVGDVVRGRYTSMLGRLTAPPSPIRTSNRFWSASVTVQEDL